MATDVEIWFTRETLKEAERMLRRWYDWPLLVAKNLYGIALVIAITAVGWRVAVQNLFSPQLAPLMGLTGIVLGLGPAAIFVWLYRREARKQAEELAALNPLRVAFAVDGLHTSEKSGANNFVPWSTFDGFREGRSVILLHYGKSKDYRAIPKNTSPPTAAEQVRSVIRSRLPEIR